MDDDGDPLERHVEEQMRLDDLQPLVDQGRRVRRHHPPHREVGVGEGLLRGDVVQVGARHTAERPAARGQDEPPYFARTSPTQALSDRAVLTVDRDQLPGSREGLDQRPADDERLLVGEGQRAPCAQRREGGLQPDRPCHPVEDDVDRTGGQLAARVRADEDLRLVCRVASFRGRGRDRSAHIVNRTPGDRNDLGLLLDGLRGDLSEVGPSGG